jgi:UDP-glucuronate 4-epimerase
VAACERIEPGQHKVYNLGGTTTTSLAELVALIEEVVGKPALLDRQPDQPGDVPVTVADITGAAGDLGYAPTTKIEGGVRAFWRWVQEEDRAGRPIA